MPSEVEHATHVLNNLRQKRDALVARGVELADERASIALAAHTGDSKASVVELILALTSDNSPERKAGAERGACVCGAHSAPRRRLH
jgi:hypothetical protein